MRLIVVVPLAPRLGSLFDPLLLLPKIHVAITEKDVGAATVARAGQLRLLGYERLLKARNFIGADHGGEQHADT